MLILSLLLVLGSTRGVTNRELPVSEGDISSHFGSRLREEGVRFGSLMEVWMRPLLRNITHVGVDRDIRGAAPHQVGATELAHKWLSV